MATLEAPACVFCGKTSSWTFDSGLGYVCEKCLKNEGNMTKDEKINYCRTTLSKLLGDLNTIAQTLDEIQEPDICCCDRSIPHCVECGSNSDLMKMPFSGACVCLSCANKFEPINSRGDL